MGQRLAVAGHIVVDEDLSAKIERFETSDLSERHKAGLRYAEAYMMRPQDIDAELAGQLRRYFSLAEIVELSVDLSAFNAQKVRVALGVDVPVAAGQLTKLTWGPDGRPIREALDGTSLPTQLQWSSRPRTAGE